VPKAVSKDRINDRGETVSVAWLELKKLLKNPVAAAVREQDGIKSTPFV
jgi:hypothetical protein